MKQGVKTLSVVIILLCFCFFSMCLSAVLPNAPIRENVLESCPNLQAEGLYPTFLGFKLFQMDNYTDTIMLFESVTVEEENPVTSIMRNVRYRSEDYFRSAFDLENYLRGNLSGLEPMEYSRYWHGYLIILRPLLEVFNYQQIRILNYILFFGLFGTLFWAVWKHIGKKESIFFFVSQIAVALPFIPYNLQFSWTFYLAYGASLFLIIREKRKGNSEFFLYLFFFVVGGLTSFMDLLTTPIITVGLPLIFLTLMREEDSTRQKLFRIVAASIVWAVGFGFIWGSKWVLGGWITGRDVIGDALNQASMRTSVAVWKGMKLTVFNIIGFILDMLASRGLLLPVIGAGVVAIVLFVFSVKDWKTVWKKTPFLLIACMTPVWFFVLREHSIQHGWYTYRALMITVFAGLLFIVESCDIRMIGQKLKRRIGK